ncbi:mannosylphosphorylation protein [Sodiomyces alkalinus F11]|uniref:Mannosylphosphorylation protein n=1 Tax=Sodiomyces alkalinus (strain CBS 110278 / VKM F-3762 / F11) TaxID=1314773 RepID=A0A3N2PXS8_SODAK|nr:mannosylphosphorylation protein [Sodiomyces alkalinus F11]ROT39339.1 mannosylphosphorylation protein [Sodiomyces alkalinus F11]
MKLGPLIPGFALLLATTQTSEARPKNIKNVNEKGEEYHAQPGKYFHESSFHVHYDGRFASHPIVDQDEQRHAIKVLVQTYLATFRDLGIETWLMHGTLLGWWWNKQILPWDTDADVMISEPSIYRLAAYYNMTTYYFEYPAVPNGRTFQLEVNPHYTIREDSDRLNVVDARWIDMENGLFIDITTASYDLDHPEGEGVLVCKDGHQFRDTYLFPLLDTTFEGVEVKIPFKYKEMLESEYGEEALTRKKFHGHVFDDIKMEWAPLHEENSEL